VAPGTAGRQRTGGRRVRTRQDSFGGTVRVLTIRLAVDPHGYDALALPVRPAGQAGDGSGAELVPPCVPVPDELAAEAVALLPQADLTGAAGVGHLTIRPTRTPGRLVLLGVGAGDEAGWRAAGATLARTGCRERSITVAMPVDVEPAAVRGLAEGLWLGSYRFRMPDHVPAEDDRPALGEVVLAVVDVERHAAALETARVTAEATRFARDLTNTPSSLKSPAWFAEQVSTAAAGRSGVRVEVREPERLAAEGFGGILAVGAGSARGPRLVELEWSPAGATRHVVLVGKGITFDTGGLSIKPRDAMKLMRKDMGGAASVVAATLAAATLQLPVRVTALAPLAENMVSGSAFRPGDVIRHYGGITSETTNSDAEGRLVLADALAYAVDRLAPDLLIDLATLTGANAVALGKRTGALYSENDELAGAVLAAAGEAGELAWRMPLVADYVEYLGSELADLYSAPDPAKSVTAALYLREFTGDLRDRWVHVDMSAPSWAERDDVELVKGATGWGVRALLRWLATLG
jgi:leucyl aminopeptidase